MAGDVRVFSSVPSTELFVELGPPMPGGSPIVIDDTNGNLYAYLSGEPTAVGGGSLPTLAAVATSGAYGDLTGTPTITTVAYGTATPTLFNTTNVTESLAYAIQYMQVGNVVTMGGKYVIRPTLAGGATTQLGMAIPVASAFTTANQAGGAATPSDNNGRGAAALADATNSRLMFQHLANSSLTASFYFNATYLIV